MMVSWFSHIRLSSFIFEEYARSHVYHYHHHYHCCINVIITTTTILCHIRPGETCYGYYKTEYYRVIEKDGRDLKPL